LFVYLFVSSIHNKLLASGEGHVGIFMDFMAETTTFGLHPDPIRFHVFFCGLIFFPCRTGAEIQPLQAFSQPVGH
jgi:hypothetical protein